MTVGEQMQRGIVTVEPESKVATAAQLLSRYNVGSLPVCTGDRRLMGVITDRDIVLRCVAVGRSPERMAVLEAMSGYVETAAPDEDCREAARRMARAQVRRPPVVEDGRLVGMIPLADLARSRRLEMEAARALCEISENILYR